MSAGTGPVCKFTCMLQVIHILNHKDWILSKPRCGLHWTSKFLERNLKDIGE